MQALMNKGANNNYNNNRSYADKRIDRTTV